jgi:hypothetical protein
MRLLASILLVSAAFAQTDSSPQPIKFRGAYVGEPLSEVVDCSGKPKALVDGYKVGGKVCEGGKGVVRRIKNRAKLGVREDGEILFFEGRKLTVIKIEVPNEDWDKVKYDLTQKLGEPVSQVPTVYQNGFGARWEYSQGFWVKDDVVAAAGVKVSHIGSEAIKKPFSNTPDTEGIEITIMSAQRAKLPSATPNSLD